MRFTRLRFPLRFLQRDLLICLKIKDCIALQESSMQALLARWSNHQLGAKVSRHCDEPRHGNSPTFLLYLGGVQQAKVSSAMKYAPGLTRAHSFSYRICQANFTYRPSLVLAYGTATLSCNISSAYRCILAFSLSSVLSFYSNLFYRFTAARLYQRAKILHELFGIRFLTIHISDQFFS